MMKQIQTNDQGQNVNQSPPSAPGPQSAGQEVTGQSYSPNPVGTTGAIGGSIGNAPPDPGNPVGTSGTIGNGVNDAGTGAASAGMGASAGGAIAGGIGQIGSTLQNYFAHPAQVAIPNPPPAPAMPYFPTPTFGQNPQMSRSMT